MHRAFLLPVFLLITSGAQADFLFERAGGAAIYDYHQDITWLQDANYAQTSGYKANGLLRYPDALIFIDYLNAQSHLGITTWRLPAMNYVTNNGVGTFGYCGTERGHNMDPWSGELAHMYFESLNLNSKFVPCTNTPQEPHGVTNMGPFININNIEQQAYLYIDEYTPDTNRTWVLHFEYGGQHADGKGGASPVWPVFDGDQLFQAGDEFPTDSGLDIKPYSEQNELNPFYPDGVINVAVFGTEDFQADDVDLSTVRFGPDRAYSTGYFRTLNLNNDAYNDMIIRFDTEESGLACGDTSMDIYGETYGGTAFIGTDSVTTIGTECNAGNGCHP